MADLTEVVGDAVDKGKQGQLNTLVAVSVSIVATFMALCNVKDGNIVQAMAQCQANAVDGWAYYQSKSTKQNIAESMVDQLKVQREVGGATMTPEARALLDKKIADYQAKAKQYGVEKNEIKAQAEGYQKQYDKLNVHDDQFDIAEASLSIAIALFGVTALTQKRFMLFVAGAFALFGTVIGFAGFLGKDLHPDFLAKLLG
jgi:hypothetical protein